ncbi:MAG: hypothetical protein QXJ06_00425 [Candidatus Aenigmatarchaeota archaeon]
MTEEKPSELVEFILITIGLIAIFITIAKPLIDLINVFIYFFSNANSQYLSELISELITVSAGTPGNVKIIFAKPKDYEYNVYFRDKMVFVDLVSYNKFIGMSNDELKKLMNKSYSSSAVEFESKNFLNFEVIVIEKNDKIKISSIGDLTEK